MDEKQRKEMKESQSRCGETDAEVKEKVYDEQIMYKPAEPHPLGRAKIIKVIEVSVLKGRGRAEDPARMVTQYWSLGGEFLMELEGKWRKEKENE